jgi:hypothetical protein
MLIGFTISSVFAIFFNNNYQIYQEIDFGTALFSKHIVYYLGGILTKIHWDKISTLLSNYVWVFIPVWFALATFFELQHKPTFIEKPNLFIETFYYYITGFSGILMTLSLTNKFVKQETNSLFVNAFSNLGTITLGLYAVHSAFLMKLVSTAIMPLNLNYWISLILVTFVSLFFSYLCVKILEKGNLLPQLFLGKIRY